MFFVLEYSENFNTQVIEFCLLYIIGMTDHTPAKASNAPISIQPKPSNHTLENFLQAVQFNAVVIPNVQDNTVDQTYNTTSENTPSQVHINGKFFLHLLLFYHSF